MIFCIGNVTGRKLGKHKNMYGRKLKLLVILLPRDKPLSVFNMLYSILFSLYILLPFYFKNKFEIILHHVFLFFTFIISISLSINPLCTCFLSWPQHIPVIVHFCSELLGVLYFSSQSLFLGTIFPVCPSLNKKNHLLPMASLFVNAPETSFQTWRSNWCAQLWLVFAISLLMSDRRGSGWIWMASAFSLASPVKVCSRFFSCLCHYILQALCLEAHRILQFLVPLTVCIPGCGSLVGVCVERCRWQPRAVWMESTALPSSETGWVVSNPAPIPKGGRTRTTWSRAGDNSSEIDNYLIDFLYFRCCYTFAAFLCVVMDISVGNCGRADGA